MSAPADAPPAAPSGDRPSVSAAPRLPTLALWLVPFGLVIAYVLVVDAFFHGQAGWTGDRIVSATVLLLGITAVFSVVWYLAAYVASLLLGEFATLGVLKLISKIPAIQRHVVITPPTRADRPKEVWGRFGALLLVALGFELIFLVLIIHRGDLAPNLTIDRPVRFFLDEFLAGLALAVLLAPAAPFFASRVRTRITDSLEFPLLWLAVLLLVLGGSTILVLEVLPGVVFNPALFLTSLLFYAPAAWYVCLAFSATESAAQQRFLRRAWGVRGGRFHFGRLKVTDVPENVTTEV